MNDAPTLLPEGVLQAMVQGRRFRKAPKEQDSLRVLESDYILYHGVYKYSGRQLHLNFLSIVLLELVQLFCDQIHGSFKTTLEVAMHLVAKASSEVSILWGRRKYTL